MSNEQATAKVGRWWKVCGNCEHYHSWQEVYDNPNATQLEGLCRRESDGGVKVQRDESCEYFDGEPPGEGKT